MISSGNSFSFDAFILNSNMSEHILKLPCILTLRWTIPDELFHQIFSPLPTLISIFKEEDKQSIPITKSVE